MHSEEQLQECANILLRTVARMVDGLNSTTGEHYEAYFLLYRKVKVENEEGILTHSISSNQSVEMAETIIHQLGKFKGVDVRVQELPQNRGSNN